MPNIFENIPNPVQHEIRNLRRNLDNTIPAKSHDNLLIATWNIRAFGRLTNKWTATDNDSPKRDKQSLLCIAEIIKSFDIIAVQEVKDNIKCLRETMRLLGSNWSFLMTDVTRGGPGNGERLAFIFNTRKVQLSGLACELVIPKEQIDNNIAPDALDRQFARTPYAVSFRAGNKTFVLLTLHVLYGDNYEDRVPELKVIADWMYDWAKKLKRWKHSLITLGDFNIDDKDDVNYNAFVSKGLYIPDDYNNISRTIFTEVKYYDQIAWFRDSNLRPQITLRFRRGGVYNFKDHVLTDRNYTNSQISFRISDHMPMWAEFVL